MKNVFLRHNRWIVTIILCAYTSHLNPVYISALPNELIKHDGFSNNAYSKFTPFSSDFRTRNSLSPVEVNHFAELIQIVKMPFPVNTRKDRQMAEQACSNIKAHYPNVPVYVHFYSPRWICRVGNYRSYEEAHQMMVNLQNLGYKQASIVKGKITSAY